jgi:hypothetical protein
VTGYEVNLRGTTYSAPMTVDISEAEVLEALFERYGTDVDEDGEPWSERTKQDMAQAIAAKRAA